MICLGILLYSQLTEYIIWTTYILAYKKARIEERIKEKMYIKVNVSRMPDIPYEMKPPYAAKTDCRKYHEPIDVVLTWVNGTDPEFLKQLKENEPAKASETGASRFKDMNQLKYAIRSFQKYAPWIRDIILVTNGQGNVFFTLNLVLKIFVGLFDQIKCNNYILSSK